MKKRTLKTIACAAVMALALSVTACGGSDDDAKTNEETSAVTEDADSEAEVETEVETEAEDTTDDTADDASAETEAEPEADTSEDGTAAYATLEEYYNDPTIKAALDASFEGMSQEGITLSVEAEGNVLTMVCKFEDSSLITDEVQAGLSEALDASSAVFESIAATFDEAINQDAGTCTYIVRYTDPDDNVLAEKEFKAQ